MQDECTSLQGKAYDAWRNQTPTEKEVPFARIFRAHHLTSCNDASDFPFGTVDL